MFQDLFKHLLRFSCLILDNNKKQQKANGEKEKEPLTNGHTEMNGHAEAGPEDSTKVGKTKKNAKKAQNNSQNNNNSEPASPEIMKEDGGDEDVLEILQDVGFSVQILSTGAEPLTIQVSSMELVQEIHQLLMDREDSCHRTCFSLQLDGSTLGKFLSLVVSQHIKVNIFYLR